MERQVSSSRNKVSVRETGEPSVQGTTSIKETGEPSVQGQDWAWTGKVDAPVKDGKTETQ